MCFLTILARGLPFTNQGINIFIAKKQHTQ